MIATSNEPANPSASPLPTGSGAPDLFDELFTRSTIGTSIVATVVLVLIALVVRTVVLRVVMRSAKLPTDIRRRWIVNVRGITFLILFIGISDAVDVPPDTEAAPAAPPAPLSRVRFPTFDELTRAITPPRKPRKPRRGRKGASDTENKPE